MTGRERILAAFRGEKPDFVPFSPNIYQWFYYRLANGQLPAEVAQAQHPFDVLRHLGADILARWDTQLATRVTYTAGEFSENYGGDADEDKPLVTFFNRYPAGKNRCERKFASPYGTLTETWKYTKEAGADYLSEYGWKSWDDYPAVRFMLEAREYTFDAEEFHRWVARVGDEGVVMVHLTQSPLKTFHWLAGAENASLFMLDHPEEMRALARIHESKALALLEKIADNADAEIFISLDNLDSVFYPPYFYKDYCHSFFSRAAEIIHRRGKSFVVHACGHNRALLPLAGKSGVDCLEGITPPPLGDVDLSEARELAGSENFVVNGGMDTHHLEISQDAEARIDEYTSSLFESMGDKRRFIFASSCNTSLLTPWENLIHFRDAARRYGRLD
jgi:Uroporphyrinogen decarboxylase (URO-D)